MSVFNVLSREYLEAFAVQQQMDPLAVPTPFPSLNACCGDDGGGIGLARGWFVTVGGNTGHGKSLLALNLAVAALDVREDVGFVSLEMSDHQLATRLYAIASGVAVKDLERGEHYRPGSLEAAREALQARFGYDARLVVNREPLRELDSILALVTAMKEQGIRFVVLDYVQLAGVGDEDSILRRVTEVSGALRYFARKHQVTVVGLSQYNRRTSSDYSQSPIAQSLMGGSPLENDSDLVALLDHSRYEKDSQDPSKARTWLRVAKNRHGRTGEIPVLWDYRTLRIREAFSGEEGLWPERKGAR